jgi:nucleoside 2-deoxyribosyltransferase
MPFSQEHKNTYEVAIKEACHARKVSCHRLDDSDLAVNLIEEMYAEINRADIIIADLSGLNPNVLYEVGYAFGVNKQIILLTDDVDNLPFNLKPLNHIVFSKDDLPGP